MYLEFIILLSPLCMFVKFYKKKLKNRDDGDDGRGRVEKGRERGKETEWSREPDGLRADPCSSTLAVCP